MYDKKSLKKRMSGKSLKLRKWFDDMACGGCG